MSARGYGETGAYRPGPLGPGYSRISHAAIAEARRAGMPNIWAVWAMLMSYTGTDGTGVWASCPRSKVAEALGIEGRQVRYCVDMLKRKGLISVVAAGHNGRASVYRLNIGDADPNTHPAATETDPTASKTDPTGPKTYPTAPETYPTASKTDPTHDADGGTSADAAGNLPYDPRRVGSRNLPLKKNQKGSSLKGLSGSYGSAEGAKEPYSDFADYVTCLKPVSAAELPGVGSEEAGADGR